MADSVMVTINGVRYRRDEAERLGLLAPPSVSAVDETPVHAADEVTAEGPPANAAEEKARHGLFRGKQPRNKAAKPKNK